MLVAAACLIGVIADFVIGERLAVICPAILLGKLIAALEPPLRRLFKPTKAGERAAGTILVIIVCLVAFAVPFFILWGLWLVSPWLVLVVSAFWCWQIMAAHALKDASEVVRQALVAGDMDEARTKVGWIVGRDTDCLDESGIAKAAVETVAENACDGVVAPLFWFFVGGAPLSMMYKAINTMDSMLGYKNEKYRYFGTVAARLDDVANFIPARITALLLILSAGLCGRSMKDAWRIWRRDHAKSTSPNSGQTETVVAGALGVELLGDAYYFGELHHKASIGDDTRPITSDDIKLTNRMMYVATILATVIGCAILVAVTWGWTWPW